MKLHGMSSGVFITRLNKAKNPLVGFNRTFYGVSAGVSLQAAFAHEVSDGREH